MLSYLRRLFGPEHLAPMPTLHPGGGGVAVVSVGTPAQPTTPTIPVPTPVAVVSPPPSGNRQQTLGPTVAIVNISSVVSDNDLSAAVAAFQIQIDRDFAPAWNTCANLIMIPTGQAVPGGTWVLFIMDTSDQAGALGYHDLTSEGYPVGKVFAKDDATYGLSWTVTTSHELMEMLADPYIQNTVFAQITNTSGTLYALEVADACQDDSFGYFIDNVLVSDFVFPAWFEHFRSANATQFDYTNVITSPLTLAKGGYIGVFTIPSSSGWGQRLADGVMPPRLIARGSYSRLNRRGAIPLIA